MGKDNKMTGAEAVITALVENGVEVIFGYPGGAVLPLYDALFKNKKIKHVLVRHEQAAVHAAEGYARSTGKVGCVLVTSGPGATNAITGLTDALMDSVPIVCLSGQVPTHLIGTDAFQECDTTGITRPCTKHNWLVKDIKDLQRIMHEAFEVATTGRPGPVLVDIPKDIQFAKTDYSKPKKEKGSTYTVKAGDNLTRIADKYNTTVDEIAELNNIANPSKISINQEIELPESKTKFVNHSVTPSSAIAAISMIKESVSACKCSDLHFSKIKTFSRRNDVVTIYFSNHIKFVVI